VKRYTRKEKDEENKKIARRLLPPRFALTELGAASLQCKPYCLRWITSLIALVLKHNRTAVKGRKMHRLPPKSVSSAPAMLFPD
jgi:hypothetical protein